MAFQVHVSPAPPINFQIGIPSPTLTATAVSSSQINLTASYIGPPAAATYTFLIATSAAGPWNVLATQAGSSLPVNSGLAASTQYFFQVNVQTNEVPARNSMWSGTATATTQSSGGGGGGGSNSTGAKKFTPGHWIELDDNTDPGNWYTRIMAMSGTGIKGAFIILNWKQLEPLVNSYTLSTTVGNLTGSINSSGILTVTAATPVSGPKALSTGSVITGSGVPLNTVVTALGSGTGLTGTYTTNCPIAVGSTSLVASNPAGFSLIDMLVTWCIQAGIQFGLGYEDRSFTPKTYSGAAVSATWGVLPDYFDTLGPGGTPGFVAAPSGTTWGGLAMIANVDQAYVTARALALYKAYAGRYEGNRVFELFRTPETAVNGGSGISDANYTTQLISVANTIRTTGYFKTTGFFFSTNFLGSDAQMISLYQAMQANSCGGLGPDNLVGRGYESNLIWNGTNGGVSYVNKMPNISEAQFPDVDQTTNTAQQVYNFAMTGALATGGSTQPNYFFWFDWAGPGITIASVISALATMVANATLPSSYVPVFDFYISTTGSDSNPGTRASPWALTAINTKRATYAGKRVGVLAGTYNCLSLVGGAYANTFSTPAFSINGGSAAASTVIQSETPRAAILDGGANATNNPAGQPLIGSLAPTIGSGYLVLDGFTILNTFNRAVSIGVATGAPLTSARALGVVVQNNYITRLTNNIAAANTTGITLYSCSGALIQNNRIQDFNDTTNRGSGIEIWTSINCTTQYNTIVATNTLAAGGGGLTSGINVKNASNSGHTIQNNFIDLLNTGSGGRGSTADLDNSIGVTINTWRNNIIRAEQASYFALAGVSDFASLNTEIWAFNTVAGIPSMTQGFLRLSQPGTVKSFCNIHGATATEYGEETWSKSALSQSNYNLYIAFRNALVPDGQNSTSGVVIYTSPATWAAAIPTGCIGKDAQSIVGTPVFASGTEALGFKLTSTSPGKNAGTVDGLVTGALTDMGAWGGLDANTGLPVSQIGCGF